MTRSLHPPYRLIQAARRAHLVRLAAVGAVVAIPTACGGGDDADTFAGADIPAAAETTPAAAATDAPIATSAPADSGAPATEPAAAEPAATVPAVTEPTTAPAATGTVEGATIPASSEMVVAFTYAIEGDGGRRIHDPYLAVWVEDTDGNLVQTIALWYQQDNKGLKWLDDLRSWYATSDGEVITSGATRPPGDYTVVWDGTDLGGNLVAAGDYRLFVEAAREHGPYSITSTPMTLGDAGFAVELPADTELIGVSATMTV